MKCGWRLMVVVAVVGVLGSAAARAADDNAPAGPVTFYKDVLPILQQNCQACHRPDGDNYTGMVAPMSLLTFEEVRPWAKSIAQVVSERRMPPWFASEEQAGHFLNERRLSEAEIATLIRWVELGAQRGRAEDAPPPRDFASRGPWMIGEPDLVVKIEPYFVEDSVEDQYITLRAPALTEEQLSEDRWVQAIEWKGGSPVVHHIVGYAFAPGSEIDESRRYGLGSIAPGEEPLVFPPGHAKRLLKGSVIVFSMHYHKEPGPGTGQWDQSMVAFKFVPEGEKVEHLVDYNGISNGGFEIPPGHPEWTVGAARTFPEDTTILGFHPHMHLRGKDARYVAYYPDGTKEVLLHVPRWDFNWQTYYAFREPKRIPAGTRIEYTARFDNSAANPANPNPTIPVRFGGPTTDEMMIGYISYTHTEPRDLDKLYAEHGEALIAGRR